MPSGSIKPSIEELKTSENRFVVLATICGVVVALGLVIEIVAVVVLDRWSWHVLWTSLLPDTLITLGIGGELWFSARAKTKGDERTRRAEVGIAEANERAAQSALLSASLFQSLEYEKARTAPRGFTDRQRAGMVRRLSRWSKLPDGSPQAATIGRYFENLEAASLRDDLADILTEAGWQVVRFLEYRGLEVSAVEVVATEDARSQQVAMVLAGSLGAVCPLLEARVHPELTLQVGSAIIGEAFAKATAMTREQWDTRVAVLVGSHPYT